MNTVKINNKSYVVNELSMADMVTMESTGFSVIDMVNKKQIFAIANAFVCVVTGLESEQASRLLEQHVLGGGDITDIYTAFNEACEESAFFKKLLGVDEKKTTQKKVASKTTKSE